MRDLFNKIFSKNRNSISEIDEAFYKKYKIKLQKNVIENGIAVSKKYKYVYARIYKSANSTVVSSLYFMETGNRIEDIVEIQSIKDNYFTQPSHLNESELEALSEYYKFTFVRNPITRVSSAYLDKIKNIDKPQRRIVEKALDKKQGEEISFDEFLFYLENGGLRSNGHWAPQADFLVFEPADYDKVGKVENLANDLNEITKKLFDKTEVVNVQQHRTNSGEHARSLNGVVIDRIYNLYKSDFDNFGYQKIV
jgi:hypothetical protein